MKKTFLFFMFIIFSFMIISVFCSSNINFNLLKAAVPTGTDRIHELAVYPYANATSSEAIVIESNGHYGLIDTGNPTGDSSPYSKYDYTFNGNDVANYLSGLGVKSLDFVILTHGHSDHVGGIPQLVSRGYIKSNTTVIYRTFNSNRSEETDYYTQYYYNKAMNSLSGKAKLLEISDHSTTNLNKINAKYVDTSGTASDYITFDFQNMNIKIFNIGSYTAGDPENRKSLVTLVTKGSQKALLMSESINYNNAINEIANYVGTVDFAKIGHYQNQGSIPLHFLIKTNPSKAIMTGNLKSNSTLNKDSALGLAYFNTTGKLLIGNEDFGKPIVMVFENNNINMYKYESGTFTEITTSSQTAHPVTGWLKVYDTAGLGDSNQVYVHINSEYKLSKGFVVTSGKTYFLNTAATSGSSPYVLAKGWRKYNGNWYYFNSTENDTYKEGEVVTRWQQINGSKYFFDPYTDPVGKMMQGFRTISNKLYYFTTEAESASDAGKMVKSKTISGFTFGSDGAATNFIDKVVKPTAISYCKTATYTGAAQVIVNNPGTGYTFNKNSFTSADAHTVKVTLKSGYIWSDYTVGTTSFICYISKANLSNSTINTIADQTYIGSAITPNPVVKMTLNGSTVTLTKDTDYTVTYSNNTNVGTATVTVTGKGNFTGTKSITFKINPDSSHKVPKPTTSYCSAPTYNGSSQTITKNPGVGYTFINNTGTNAGTYLVQAALSANYRWSDGTSSVVSFSCPINSKSISGATISVQNQEYDGTAKTPAPTVKDGSKTLTANTDYTVSYSNNTNVGTATVTVTGTGNYKGTASTTFEIKAPIILVDKPTTSYCKAITYNGSPQTLTNTPGTGYTFSNNTGTNVGTYTVTAKLKTNYKCSCSIVAKSINNVTIITPEQVYNGSPLTPLPAVKDGTTTLIKDTDYTVSYSDNTNVGTASITITGKGNYTGSKNSTFTIKEDNNIAEKPTTSYCSNTTYNGSSQTVTNNPGIGYTFSNNTGTNAGNYTVTAVLKSNYKWSDDTTTNVTFICPINPKSISAADIYIQNQVYDGTAKTPIPIVKDGSRTLTENVDYTLVSYSNNVNVGTASLSISGKDNYTGTITGDFMIVEPESTFYIKDSSYMKLENNRLNTKLKSGINSINRFSFLDNISSSNTWIPYNKNDAEISSSGLITTGSYIKNGNTEYKIVIYGDIDQDGLITIKDLYQSYLLYKNKATGLNEYQISAADYNNDGLTNIKDLYEIYKKMKNK